MATRRVSRVSTEHYTRKIKGGDAPTNDSTVNPTEDINQFNKLLQIVPELVVNSTAYMWIS